MDKVNVRPCLAARRVQRTFRRFLPAQRASKATLACISTDDDVLIRPVPLSLARQHGVSQRHKEEEKWSLKRAQSAGRGVCGVWWFGRCPMVLVGAGGGLVCSQSPSGLRQRSHGAGLCASASRHRVGTCWGNEWSGGSAWRSQGPQRVWER